MPFAFVRPDRNWHIKNTHPEFVQWHHHYLRTVYFWGFITIGIIVIANFVWLEFNGPALYGLLPYPAFIIVAYGVILLRDFSRRVERFAQEWRKAHTPLLPET